MQLISQFASVFLARSFSQFLSQGLRHFLPSVFHMAMICTSKVCLGRGVCIGSRRVLLHIGVGLMVLRISGNDKHHQ
jgi:hypothetical protein